MGKMLPPFSPHIEAQCHRWASFKRALPKEDQAMLDRPFDDAMLQVHADVMASRPWAVETIVMAIQLEQEKRLEPLIRQMEAPRAVFTRIDGTWVCEATACQGKRG
jgi:hypothetical protein